jgi:hypothetical protein
MAVLLEPAAAPRGGADRTAGVDLGLEVGMDARDGVADILARRGFVHVLCE